MVDEEERERDLISQSRDPQQLEDDNSADE